MKKIGLYLLVILGLTSCQQNKIHTIFFDGSKEVSGQKIALREINPNLPEDWDEYNYIVLDYRINTAQRFQLGFTTEDGYNELRVMSYVPNAWNRIAIPMEYFTAPPAPAHDLAATFNHARYTGWINLGGERYPMHKVDSVGFRMRKAIGDVKLDLRNITLSVEDPGDVYLGEIPAVDRFGQSNLVDYPDKVHSMAELRAQWDAEAKDMVTTKNTLYSRFGGYLYAPKSKATGFFRVEEIDGKWWFIDPEGYRFLSVGVDCVHIYCGGNVVNYDKRPSLFEEKPSLDTLALMGTDRLSFGMINTYRRYGASYEKDAVDMVIKRMDRWGLNTIANWSSDIVKDSNRKAFMQPLGNMGLRRELMGLCDIYDDNCESELQKSIESQVGKYKENPWLIGYFIGNEPAWLNEESRLCDIIMDSEHESLRAHLVAYLDKHGDSEASRKEFIYDTFEKYLIMTNRILKKFDPNHLNLGIRFGDPHTLPDRILELCHIFDVFSFNCYQLTPDHKMLDRTLALSGRPMIIGEYHFGTVDRGYAQSLWQVDNQEQRGVAYRYYTENAYSHPGLIGTGYFTWGDQDLTGRGDGENYNCGLIDVTDRPYKELTDALTKSYKVLYDTHMGKIEPYSEKPLNCRGHEQIPDLWNE